MKLQTLDDTAKELLRFRGNVRGEVVLNHFEYIKGKEGKGGAKKLEEKLRDVGVSLDFNKIKPLDWVSEGVSALTVVASKEIFFWENKDIFEMGRVAPHLSFALKMLAQNFVDPKRLFEESPIYWNNLFDFGSLVPVSFSESSKKGILQIKEYKTHPLLCVYHAGYIQGITEFALKSKKVSVKEIKCVYKGSDYDEYEFSWSDN